MTRHAVRNRQLVGVPAPSAQERQAALIAKLQHQVRLAEVRNDPAVRGRLAACDRDRFDPAYRLSRLDLVAPR